MVAALNNSQVWILNATESEGVLVVEQEQGETDCVVLQVERAVFSKGDLERAGRLLLDVAGRL